MKEGLEKPDGPKMMGIEECWAHMILTDKTVKQFQMDRNMQIRQKAVHYPAYNKISEAKKGIYKHLFKN